MDKNVEKTVKNVLAVVGALAVVKAAPVLATGVAIGAAVSNTDKIKQAMNDFAERMDEEVAKFNAEFATGLDNENNFDPCSDPMNWKTGNTSKESANKENTSASEEGEGDLYEQAEPVTEELGAETQQPENADEAPKSREELLNELIDTVGKLFAL